MTLPEHPSMLDRWFGLHDQVAIVTGGANGIGREIARHLAVAGAQVLILDVDAAAVEGAVADLAAHGQVAGRVADVTSEEDCIAAVESAAAPSGRVDLLVNCAGIYPFAPVDEVSVDIWRKTMDVNLLGAFLMTRAAARQMRKTGSGGAVVNISSVNSVMAAALDNVHYGASKAGLNHLTKALALEFAEDRIRVNAVMPGGIRTENSQRAAGGRPRGPILQPGRMPLGMGQPADIAGAVLFLGGPAARYITGQILAVDGGFLVS